MSTIEDMLGNDVTNSELRGETDADTTQSEKDEDSVKEESVKEVEDKEVQVDDGNIDSKSKVVDFKSKYDEEKGYRTRLLSENKEYKAELKELRVLKKEFEELRSAQQKIKEVESVPDPKEDPIGYLQNTLSSLRKDIESLKQDNTEQTKVNTQQTKVQDLVKVLQRSARTFGETNPNFDDSVRFLSDVRTKELKTYGYDDNQIEKIISYDVLQLAQNAIDRELNPAELLYDLAKVKGYISQKEVKEGFNKLEKGSKRSKSLSSVGESLSSASEDLSLNELLNASDEDFDKYWDKVMTKKS